MRTPWLSFRAVIAIAIPCLIVQPAHAQWTAGGVAVCTAGNTQGNVRVAPDGAGGMIAAWEDARVGTPGVYAQRLNAAGVPQWAPNGVLLAGAGSRVRVLSDGAGGAIAIWRDSRSGAIGVYGQRVNASGVAQWTAGGVRLSTTFGEPMIDADGAGGAVIGWFAGVSPTRDIYAQRVNASGVAQWGAAGATVCRHPADQFDVRVASDGGGGAILAWRDTRAGTNRIFARRVGAAGDTLWAPNGTVVSPNSPATFVPAVAADGAGGALIAVPDQRQAGQGTHLYIYRMTAAGAFQPGWVAGGVDAGACFVDPDAAMINDGSGGAIAVQYGGKVDHVTSSGVLNWSLVVSQMFDLPIRPTLVSDGSGGAYVAWDDFRNSTDFNLYATRVLSGGTLSPSCTPSGEALSQGSGSQMGASICAVAGGGALVAWNDSRTDGGDVYAAPITCGSTVGVEPINADGLALVGAWPNPASRSLRVTFILPDAGSATLSVLDLSGRVVLRHEVEGSGTGPQSLILDPVSRLAAGTYFLKLEHNGRIASRKFSVLR